MYYLISPWNEIMGTIIKYFKSCKDYVDTDSTWIQHQCTQLSITPTIEADHFNNTECMQWSQIAILVILPDLSNI